MELNRRNFVTGTTAIAAASALAAGTVAAAQADEAAPSEGMSADLVVVGAGVGGLTTGVRALQNGVQNVIIVEASRWVGGGSSFSLGSMHTNGMGSTVESYKAATGYQSTSDLALESFVAVDDFFAWISAQDLPLMVEEKNESIVAAAGDRGRARMVAEDGETMGLTACKNFFESFASLFESLGGTLLRQTSANHVLMDDAKTHVTGITCVDANGNPLVIETPNVVLACGGYQGNHDMMTRWVGPDAYQTAVMGTPYNNGGGVLMAQECGAILQGDMSHMGGLLLPAAPAKNWMEDIAAYEESDYNGEEGGKWWYWMEIIDEPPVNSIMVNCYGKRFVDEDRPRNSWKPEISQQKRGTGIVICDAETWDTWMMASGWGLLDGATQQDRMDVITSDVVGGAYFEADTIEELCDKMNATGIDTYSIHKANLVKTIEEYNAAAEAGTGADLEVPRVTNPCVPIVEPPFYALPIRNAIFVTFGGVAIDTNARVLDNTRKPIPGLYACSPTAGGMMNEYYAGSMAHAGVTGLWAADDVAARVNG